MNRYLVILILIFLAGCGRKTVVRKFYVIESPIKTSEELYNKPALLNASCEVNAIDIYPAFGSTEIAFRNESHQLVYYNEHFWAVKPDDIMRSILVNHLQHERIFERVSDRFWKIIPEYQLETVVYQLESIQVEKQLQAHLHLEFKLIDNKSRRIILTYEADDFETLEKRDINLFAKAISKLYHQEINNFSEKIRNEIKVLTDQGN